MPIRLVWARAVPGVRIPSSGHVQSSSGQVQSSSGQVQKGSCARPAWWRVTLVGFALVAGLLASACAGPEQTGSLADRVNAWVSQTQMGAAVQTLKVDALNVTAILKRHDPPSEIRTACALLTTDSQTAEGNLTTPDQQLTNELYAAYQDGAAAGTYCFNGAKGNRSLLARSDRARAALPGLLDVAVARVRSITGQTPPTSTTSPAQGSGDPFAG